MAPPSWRSQFWERIVTPDAVLLITIVAGAVLRCWGVGAQSLWFDEWLTTEAVSGGVGDLFEHVANREGIPPPWFLFMWGWVRLFGDSETALRSVSALAGIATIPVAYALARELGQRQWVARSAALLVALNPMLVWYSQEARPYSLLAFFGALSMLTFVRAWNRGRRGDYLVWGLVCASALTVHYYAGFLVAAELGAFLLLRRLEWRRVLLGSVPVVAIIALLAPFALEQSSHSPNRRWISSWPLDYRLSETRRAVLAGPASPRDWLWLLAAAMGAVAAVLILTRGSRGERTAATLLVAVAGAAVLMPLAAAAIGFDVFLSRYLIGGLVPVLVAASVGFGVRRAIWIGGAALIVVCTGWLAVSVAVARDPDLQKPQWRRVAEVFESAAADRALVLNGHLLLGRPLRYYTEGARQLEDDEEARVDMIDVLVYKATPKWCDFLVGRACSLLFLGAPLSGPLASRFVLVERLELEQFTVDRYRAGDPVLVTKEELVAPGDPAVATVWVRSG
jgi:4-amino-4-deoxy-L-arabinose transferase-like glycosyltransferase